MTSAGETMALAAAISTSTVAIAIVSSILRHWQAAMATITAVEYDLAHQ